MKPLIPSVPAAAFAVCSLACALAPVQAGEAARKSYDIAAGDAVSTLKRFADESGRQVVFLVEAVRGTTTNAVRGEYTVREALTRLVADTGLAVAEDAQSGALMVNRLASREPPSSPPQPKPKTNAMSPKPRTLLAAFAGWLALSSAADAQTVKTSTKDEAVVLSPFTVNTDKDDGFAASNAGTATRLALDMKDVPAPFSIMTQDFIEALGITDVQQAVAWMPNVGAMPSEDVVTGPLNFNSRGVNNGRGQTRNNYLTGGLNDSYALERYEFGRGPNAALFNIGGGSSLTGGLGAQTKRPRFDRTIDTVSASFGSWTNLRTTLDVNRPLTDKLAIRGNLLWADSEAWLQRGFSKSKGVTAAVAYLLTPKTELRIEGAYDRMTRHQPSPDIFDGLSGWDGVTVFREPVSNLILGTQTAAGTPNSLGHVLTFQGESQGINRRNGKYYVWNAFNGQNAIINYQNEAFTRKADDTANTPLYGNGTLFIRGTGLPYGLGYQGSAFPVATQAPDGQHNLRYQLNEPADIYARVVRGSAFRPIGNTSNFSMAPDTFMYGENLRDLNINLSHQLGERWFFELGGNINNVYGDSNREGMLGFRTIRVDINQLLPSGANNPFFLQPYGDGFVSNSERSYLNKSVRGNVAYRRDLGKWGDYTVNFNLASNARTTVVRWHRYSVAQEPDPRMWQNTPIYIRQYLNQPSRPFGDAGVPAALVQRTFATDNNSATTANLGISPRWTLSDWNDTKEEFDNGVLAMSARFFRGKLVALAVSRYDRYKSQLFARPEFGDLPPDWNPQTLIYKPTAPSDWATLRYVPRNATGVPTQTQSIPAATRPRQNAPGVVTNNGVQIRNPFYTNERFRNDYSPPANEGSNVTGSYGLAYHVARNVSLIANYATSYIPPATNAFDLRNELVEPLRGRGYDGGLRFHLFQDRLTFNTSYFYNREKFQRVASPVTASVNSLLARNTATDPSTDGRNSLGIPDIFGTDYQSAETSGFELEVVGKIARGWRVMFNLGTAKVYTFDRYPQTKGFIEENLDFYRQVLEEAGGRLDTTQRPAGAPGLAVANAAITPAVPAERTNAVLDYNNIWANYALVTGDLPVAGNKRMTVNLFSDYTIQSGRLKGLRIGVGARDPGRVYIMSRSADTIIDPNNPALAIDDPKVDQTTPVYYRQPIIMTGSLGYTMRMKGWGPIDGREVSFNLVIRNLLDTSRPTYSGTQGSLRQPDGDYSKPNRVATPTRVYGLTEPRTFLFTTTLRL
ncbi:MAG: hypothetical protein NTX09_16015 [Verrucomicrobia bacterium]|nr:hypothetical protein [Verrucomicrobiota bacterium]